MEENTTDEVEILSCPICSSSKIQFFLETKDYTVSNKNFTIKRCNECEFCFTSPQPSLKNLASYYKSNDYISHSDSKKGVVNQLYHVVRNFTLKSKYNLVKKYSSPKDLVVDYGAGTGAFVNYLYKNKINVLGFEPDADARSVAFNKYQIKLKSIEDFEQNYAGKIKVITLWHVLEHVPSLDEFIEIAAQNLQDNGIMIIALPNRNSYDAKHYQEQWAAYDVPRHLWHFRKEDIVELMANNDFDLIDTKPMPYDSFYVSLLSEAYLGRTGLRKLFNAFSLGLASNLKASKTNYSSMIYVFRKIG
jgi:2-polyprenyl-3-methyl-5-hydroxy-6-metoxy-1,4-benzoquinol methylase